MSPRNLRISIPLALLTITGVAILMAQQSSAPAPFTAAQSSAGRTIYQERCSSCHMPNLQGNGDAPPLAGAGFASTWGDRQVRDLVAFIQATMPPGAGGSLGEPAYLNLAAFILESNGARAGNQAMRLVSPEMIRSFVNVDAPATTAAAPARQGKQAPAAPAAASP